MTPPSPERARTATDTPSDALELISWRSGPWRWTAEPRLRPWIEETLQPAADLRAVPGAALIKLNRLRTVVRVAADEAELFLKGFHQRRFSDRAKSLILGSKAANEFERARRVYAAGVPTARPALVGERRRRGIVDACLIGCHALPGASDYPRVLDAARALGAAGDAEREASSRALAALSHRLFSAGFLHGDYHLGNILIDGEGALYAIDLDAVRVKPWPSPRKRRAVLARIALSHAPFRPEVLAQSRAEIKWMCEAYAALDAELGSAEALYEQLLIDAHRLEDIRLRSRDKRCVVNSTQYAVARGASRALYRRSQVSADEVEAATRAAAVEVLHRSGRSVVELIPAPPGMAAAVAEARGGPPPERIVRKRIFYRRPASFLATLLSPTKGLRAWLAARAFEVRELPTAHAVALVERRVAWALTRESVLFLEEVPGVQLHRYVIEALRDGLCPASMPAAARRALVDVAAAFLVRLQETGIRHRDLAMQNVLVEELGDEPGPAYCLRLVDLDTARIKPLRGKDRMRNLVHFADLPTEVGLRDMVRFFRRYLSLGGTTIMAEELKRSGSARELRRQISLRLEARMAAKRARRIRRERSSR